MFSITELTRNKRVAGARAKLEGRSFERCFELACEESKVAYIRLPETGGKFVGKGRFKSEPIICDYILGFQGHTILADVKSLNEKSLSYSFSRKDSFYKQMTKLSLWQNTNKEMKDSNSRPVSVFIVNLRKSKSVVAFLPSQLLSLRSGKSLTTESAYVKLGTVYNDIEVKNLFNVK